MSPRTSRSRAPTRMLSRSRSQQRAGAAIAVGYFAEEITPVEVPGGKAGPITVDKDEHPRAETTLERLAKLEADRAQSRHGDGRQRVGRQ